MMYVMSKDRNMSSSISEIGSEFWIEDFPLQLTVEKDGLYTISGRTAIDLILQDILRKRAIQRIYMPAWCCNSMIAPFSDRGLDVLFYDLSLSGSLKYEIDEGIECDVFYLTNYFGYENTLPEEIIRSFKRRGAVIIYDRTHSFLMNDKTYREMADYSFASVRKWMGVVGGAVVEGLAEKPILKRCPYALIKEEAMLEKWRYLQGGSGIEKRSFLEAFSEFNHCLSKDYRNYEMDSLSYTLYKLTDLKAIKTLRRRNAVYLHTHLYRNQFLGRLTDSSVPLFVPVFFDTKVERDSVRKKLIEKSIYCPIHWPKPGQISKSFAVNEIYERELSLVCDQRYGYNEMQKIVDIINFEI